MKKQNNILPVTQFDNFIWRVLWLEFGEGLKDLEERINFYRAIIRYGLDKKEPELKPGAMDFFNNEIRPDIDRQHNNKIKNLQRNGNGK